MKQARQLCMVFALEVRGELFRPASHTQEMFNERLTLMSFEWHGIQVY